MSEHVLRQVKRELLRYRLQTEPGLSAEEAELYLMAAIDEVSLACLLVHVGNTHYDDPLRDAPHTPEDFAKYRRFIRVVSISYENPWELVFEVIGSAGVVATAIQTMYHLRSARRKTEAETEKLTAETEQIEAGTRNLNAGLEREELQRRLEASEKVQKQIDLASMLIARERQDRRTREFLAEIVLGGKHYFHLQDVDPGIRMLKALLDNSLYDTIERITGPEATLDPMVRQKLSDLIADHTRLIASIRRLDEVERSVEVLDGDDQD